jgi:hypothetical protein
MSDDTPFKWGDVMADMEANREAVCEYAGHDWAPAGGGLLICTECLAEQWEDERG